MSIEPDFALTAREFDFVWAHLELGDMPYPIDVPGNGATQSERARLRAETFDGLRDKGFLRDERLDPDLAGLLRVLAAPTVSIDTVGYGAGPIRGLAASDGGQAALAAVSDETVAFAAIRPTSLATSIVALLPPGDAGSGIAISLPRQALRRAVDGGSDDEADDPFDTGDERDILMANGVSDEDATSLIELADRRVRGGQFGVTTVSRPTRLRPGTPTRATTMITWFDTGDGRYLMVHDGAWVSLAPADAGRIAHRIDELLRTSGK
jgi:hypothetical protein